VSQSPARDGPCILLVDDDELDRASVRRALRSEWTEGEILEASNATTGLELLKSGRVRCTFLDFNMPARDGLWLVREARAQGVLSPLIVLTGQGDEHTAVELMKAGATDYFCKSEITPERVAASLRQALRVFEAEAAHRHTEQRLRLAVEATELGTWDFDPKARHFGCSERCRALFNLPASEGVAYDTFLAALHPEDRPRVARAVREALDPASRGMFDVECRTAVRAGSGGRWLRATGRAFFDPAGHVVRFIGTAQDIEDRKLLEVQRAQLLEAERVARERAEAASRTREDLMAVVSHDLRNPLSAIATAATLLRRNSDADPTGRATKQAELILRSADRMARLISDLLDIACIDAGRLSVELLPHGAASLLQEANELFQLLAAEKLLRLTVEAPDPSLSVIADRERVLQVLANLVGNALKFTPAGGNIRLRAQPDGGAVRFSIVDSGPGVSSEQLPHIFDRYWQAKRDGRLGIGLGLSIAKGIVEAHGGHIWAESAPGEGSSFHFTLPSALLGQGAQLASS
jgi:signal transduction histidine kinase/DNA-binding response OmpR family regulator